MLPFRSVREARFTELTTPRIIEPAGISTSLPRYKSTAVVASNRSSTCAVPDVSSFCSLTSISRDGLREIGHGHWEGLTRAEVETRFAAEYAAWEEDPFTFAPEGGESGFAVLARALPVVREIVTAHAGQRVLVVSHKATIRLLLSSLLGFDARGYRDRLDQAPACLNVLDFRDPVRARLMLFNDTSHYDRSGLAIPAFPQARLSKWWDERKE